MHDPLHTQSSMGAYSGAANPFGAPYAGIQTGINPAAFNPLAGIGQGGGISPFGQQGYQGVQQGYGIGSNIAALAQQQQQLQQLQQQQQLQQLERLQQIERLQQLAAILASQGGGMQPELYGGASQMPGWQNPLQQAQQFPLLTQLVQQNPLLAQQIGQPYPLLAQQHQHQHPALAQLFSQWHPGLAQLTQGQYPMFGQPLQPNPLLAHLAQNALFAQQQNPLLAQNPYAQNWQQLGQINSLMGQQTGVPFGQFGQGGYQLAPQSWIGQGAGQFAGGQQIPAQLAQFAARGLF